MHINLVRVIHSIQNSCISHSTQNQHFAEMFTYCTLTILVIIWISIILLFQFICDFIYSAIIRMCLMSVMNSMEFSRAEHSADHSALFRRYRRNLIALSQQWLIRVEYCGRAKPLRGECNIEDTIVSQEDEPRAHTTQRELAVELMSVKCRYPAWLWNWTWNRTNESVYKARTKMSKENGKQCVATIITVYYL
jgi:hypothetical protein